METRTETCEGDLLSPYSGRSVQHVKMAQRIEVITSYRGKKLPLRWHNCIHTKAKCFGSGNGRYYLNGDWFDLSHVPLYGYSRMSQIGADASCTREQWESIMDHMDLGIATRVSLPNFLMDCATMAESCLKFATHHKSKLPKNARKGSYLDRPAALWLFYNYGIKPFVSDLNAILHAQQNVQRKAAAMRRNFATVQHCKTRFTPNVTVYGSTIASPFSPSLGERLGNAHNTAKGTFMATYIPTSLVDVSGLTLASNYLGINKFGDAVWDAIPFSFCADWFIDTQRWVRGFNVNNWQGGVIWLSAGCQSHQQYSQSRDALDGSSEHRCISGCQEVITRFTRTCGPPIISDGDITNDRFGARQASYAAALIHQILGKYR